MWWPDTASRDPMLRHMDRAEDFWWWTLSSVVAAGASLVIVLDTGMHRIGTFREFWSTVDSVDVVWFLVCGFFALMFAACAIDAYLTRRRLFAALQHFMDFQELAERYPFIPMNMIRRRYEELRKNTGTRHDTQERP